ncbi:SHOCT domain-containing protein [Actinosynnema sp. NPDC053489]|uniref:SHOCT domain-containing protein n=1 Tax=Actinosynnema sp. NPDC053489 TaxID=3363916 RepID=UPI0037CBC9FE
MSVADELAKLQRLHRSGALSDVEFSAAKRRLLEPGPPVHDQSIGRAANRYVTFRVVASIVAGIVGLTLFLVFLFGVIIPAFDAMHDDRPPSWPGFDNAPVVTFP